VFGSIVWAIADETVMPALGLSRGPRELTAGTHVQALAGHWVYGATVDFARRQDVAVRLPRRNVADPSTPARRAICRLFRAPRRTGEAVVVRFAFICSGP
jgi:hypothetical protein